MKKILYSFTCILLSTFLFLGVVNAAKVEISDGESFASETKKSVDLTISGEDLSEYTKIEFEVSLSAKNSDTAINADIESVSPKIISTGTEFDGSKSPLYIISNTNGLENGMTINIFYTTYEDFNADFILTPVNVKLYKEEGEPTVLDAKSIKAGTIKYLAPASTDATLKSLTVSQGTLTPVFDKDVYEYTVDVSDTISILSIGAVANDSKATIEGNGRKNLEFDKNEFEIKVTAEDKKTTLTYKITIYRGEVSEPSAYLKELNIKDDDLELSPEFDNKNNKYTVDAPAGTKKLNIEYVPEDRNATVEISGNEDFESGENKIIIKVTSSNKEDTQEYEIIVNVDKEKEGNKPAQPIDVKEEDQKKPGWLVKGAIGAAILLILAFTAWLLFRKKKKNKKKKNQSVESPVEPDNKPLYDEQETTTYDINSFREQESSEEIEKTKEFHFDFRDDD